MVHTIYDLEVYPNYFLAMFKDVGVDNYYTFEISERKNEANELRRFLYRKDMTLIGFNNLNFDYPILHNAVLKAPRKPTHEDLYAQMLTIFDQKYPSIAPWEVMVPQIDLYKIWHYDNKAKRTSLKWLEFAMRMHNVQDLPFKPGESLSHDQMDITTEYCKNDINATEQFYLLSDKHIKLRKDLSELYNLDLINASEIRIAKDIFAKFLSEEMNIDSRTLRSMQTFRSHVKIADLIFPYIAFEDPINIDTLEKFKSKTWLAPEVISKSTNYKQKLIAQKKSENTIKFTKEYNSITRVYAEGGLHSFGEPGVYESNDTHILVDVDFASYYPHLSFRNDLGPEHIPKDVFNKLYEGFYHERKKYPKSDPRNYVLKIVLNGSYGLSKDKYSYLFDPKWQLAITINGQLLLTLLTEQVLKHCKKDVKIIFENTDGCMYRIHRSDIDNLTAGIVATQQLSKIPLETQQCNKIIIRDVNNYINIISSDNIKFKGVFEIDRDYHKNHSKRVVAIAVANYFINGVDPGESIRSHLTGTRYDFADNHNIFDYCIGTKIKSKNDGLVARTVKGARIIEDELPNMVRYYISNDGKKLVKKLPPLEKSYKPFTEKHKEKVDPGQVNIFDFINDNVTKEPVEREEELQAGYLSTVFNVYKDGPYDINYDYYINECNKIIKAIES